MAKRNRHRINVGNQSHHVPNAKHRASFLFRQFEVEPLVARLSSEWGHEDHLHALWNMTKAQPFSTIYDSISPFNFGLRKLFFELLKVQLGVPPFVVYLCRIFELTLQQNLIQQTHPKQMDDLQDLAGDVGSLDIEKYFVIDALITSTAFAFIAPNQRDSVHDAYLEMYARRIGNTKAETNCPAPHLMRLTNYQKSMLIQYAPDLSQHAAAPPARIINVLLDSLFYSEARMQQHLAAGHNWEGTKLTSETQKALISCDNLYYMLRGQKAYAANTDPTRTIRDYDLLWNNGDDLYAKRVPTLCLGAPLIRTLVEAFSIGLAQNQDRLIAYFNEHVG